MRLPHGDATKFSRELASGREYPLQHIALSMNARHGCRSPLHGGAVNRSHAPTPYRLPPYQRALPSAPKPRRYFDGKERQGVCRPSPRSRERSVAHRVHRGSREHKPGGARAPARAAAPPRLRSAQVRDQRSTHGREHAADAPESAGPEQSRRPPIRIAPESRERRRSQCRQRGAR